MGIEFIVLGDLHLRTRGMLGRKDDIFTTQLNKFNQVVSYAESKGITYILQVGDFFDKACPERSESIELLNGMAKLLYKSCSNGLVVISVYGQHDLYMRSYKAIEKSNLNLLYNAGLVEIADDKPICLGEKVFVYGCSYGMKIPGVRDSVGEVTNVLLSHEPVLVPVELRNNFIFKKLIREDSEGKENIKGYSILVNGDWHYSYCSEHRGIRVVNPGCVLRERGAKDFVPGFNVIKIGRQIEVNREFFQCASDVFDDSDVSAASNIVEEDVEKVSFKEFLDSLKGGSSLDRISFVKNIEEWLKTEKNKELREVVEEALAYVREK